MSAIANPSQSPSRPLALVVSIAVGGVVASALLGAVTNAINGAVSPQYFIAVLGWEGIEDVWRASIAQGILEGLLFGFFLSLVFTVGVGVITRASCSVAFAMRYLAGIVVAATACWCIGGVAAMGLALLSPEFYRRSFIGVPDGFGAMLGYSWVGGSIVGLQLGGLMAVVVALLVLRGAWRSKTGHAEQSLAAESR